MMKNVTSNFSLKLVSLVIAVVLWFVVLGSRNVEITKEVPVEVVTPSDLVVANDVPDKVSFRLSGPKAFLRNILNRKEAPIRVNLANAKAGLVTYRFFSDNIEVPIGVKVLFINPTAIVVKLEPVKNREVPVKIVTKGQVAPGYRISNIDLVKSTVKIRGAESKVDSVTELQTMPVDLGELHESGDRETPIDLGSLPGVSVEGDLPKVHFDVVQETANFKIRNVKIKVLTDRRFQVTPAEASLYVICNPDELKALVRSKVFAIADLRRKGPGTYEVPLTAELPSTVKLIRVLPQKAKVTIF